MENITTFEVDGNERFRITCETTSSGYLQIRFEGPLLLRRGEPFDAYMECLRQLTDLATKDGVTHVHCHLEELGETISRAQHAIYRMLNSMREQGNEITIHTAGASPESAEHQRMSRLFAEGLQNRPGPAVHVVELGESR